jgi:hypothetical protein
MSARHTQPIEVRWGEAVIGFVHRRGAVWRAVLLNGRMEFFGTMGSAIEWIQAAP